MIFDSNDVDPEMWSAVDSGGSNGHPAPCARAKHSATLLCGRLYVLGGRGAGGAVPLRDFWRYCLASGKWEKLECRGESPPSLQEHTTTAHEGKLYVFGGEAACSNETPLWIYDTETEEWRKLPGQSGHSSLRRRGTRQARGAGGAGAEPRGRRGHSAHALKDCMLVYGGYKDLRGSTNELWAFHYETESWQQVRTRNAGPARHRHAAALHDGRLYVHGGQCDLRDCADLWCYDTMSRVWSQVRAVSRLTPAARSGHAGLRAGAHFYIFGGESNGHACPELWRFHFATETWERIAQSVKWPSPRVDSCILLVPSAPPRVRSAPAPAQGGQEAPEAPAPGPRAEAGGLLRELSRLSRLPARRAARGSYSALGGLGGLGGLQGGQGGGRDSTESLLRHEAALAKSHSAYLIHRRPPELARERASVPDFGDVSPPAAEVAALVYLDSDEDGDGDGDGEAPARSSVRVEPRVTIVALPESASVRFAAEPAATDDEEPESTSDYASAERVNRLSLGGFSNPHYLGPDVRRLGAALTPDSGVCAGPARGDIELRDLGPRRPPDVQLHLLLVGGREPSHVALLQSPLSMWSYRLL